MHSVWEVSIDELREMLKCTSPYYRQFKFFNQEILQNCQKEINEKTDCHFEYKLIKKGRSVTGIKITVSHKGECDDEIIENLLSEVDPVVQEAFRNFAETRKVSGAKLTARATKLLLSQLKKMESDPKKQVEILNQSTMYGWKSLRPLEQGEKEWKPKGSFYNFEQRTYDPEEEKELEKRLLRKGRNRPKETEKEEGVNNQPT